MFPPRIRIFCLPDISKPIGGVKQLYRHAEHLCALGFDCKVLTQESGFRPGWFHSSCKTLSYSEWIRADSPQPSDTILVFPETYIGMNLANYYGHDLSGYKIVVFNQNAYYTFGSGLSSPLDEVRAFYHSSNVLNTLVVSEDSYDFLRAIGLPDHRLSRIINAVDRDFNLGSAKNPVMHWMPRKNPQHVQAVLTSLQLSASVHSQGWSGSPLEDLSHSEVAERLREASIFLSFGHPEGFGLPVAEAMAAGCYVVGYHGGGGKELFKYGFSESCDFGDWTSYVTQINNAFTLFATSPEECALRARRQSEAVRTLYSPSNERSSIDTAWTKILKAFSLNLLPS